MKKSIYFALAVASLALFACNSKPANSEEQAEEQVEITLEQAEEFAEEALEAGEPEVSPDETGETSAEEGLKEEEAPAAEDSVAAEEPSAEEAPAAEEQPAEEPAKEKAKAEEPATPSDKFPIDRSDGNFIAFVNEIVTADADGCVPIAFVMDKIEESKIRFIVQIETLDGRRHSYYPVGVEPGGTKGNFSICASLGSGFSFIVPGEQYKVSIVRAMRL